MAKGKIKVVDLYAPSSKRKKPNKVSDRLFPKFLAWILGAIVIAGIVAKILHHFKHH